MLGKVIEQIQNTPEDKTNATHKIDTTSMTIQEKVQFLINQYGIHDTALHKIVDNLQKQQAEDYSQNIAV